MPWYWTDDIDDALAALKLFGTDDPQKQVLETVAIFRPETSIEELLAALEDEDEPRLAA